jgi:ADP-ribose pyrophosphatase
MQPWKTISRQTILEHSKFLSVESHTVELPDGTIIEDWPWIITPNFVNVLAVTDENKFLCFRQTKYAFGGVSLAPVGGYIEDDEDPLEAAKRELLEETGYHATEWISLGNYWVMPNRGGAVGHFYLACGAHFVESTWSDDLEEQELLFLAQEEVEQALLDGEIKSAIWSAVVALALLRLKTQEG